MTGRRRLMVLVLIVGAAGLAAFLALRLRSPRPENVLLFTLDTTRADALGCYRRELGRTPHLDRLAARGVLFERCATVAPMTLPAHASLMTSLWPPEHGARRNGTDRLPPAVETLAESLTGAGWAARAAVAAYILNRRFGLDQGFEEYAGVPAGTSGDPLRAERSGDEVAADAVRMLRQLAGRKFFLWVHFYDPHHPYRNARGVAEDTPEAYADEVAYMDQAVGRVLGELDDLGLARRTLIVAAGDHGEAFGEHGEKTHGFFLYETTVRVPLLVCAPGRVPAGRRVRPQVSLVDVAPTILDLLGLTGLPEARGRSLQPLWAGEAAGGRIAYAETLEPEVQFGFARLRSLTGDRWKYILAPRPELYDLAADPAETRDAGVTEPAVAAEQRARLAELVADFAPPPAAEPAPLDEEAEARLRSLGYAAAGIAPAAGGSESEHFEPRGPDPKDAPQVALWLGEARTAAAQGRFETAEAQLARIAAAAPGSGVARIELAQVLRQQGRLDEAIEAVRAAVALDPDGASARLELARALETAGRLEEAIEELRALLGQHPSYTPAMFALGTAMANSGYPDEARRWFVAGLELEPANARFLHAMGTLHARQGLLEEAESYFLRALESDPGSKASRDSLKRVRALLAGS